MTTAIIFILILGVLIFVHELGHYLIAIRNGIKADEFGFGFPPRIVGAVKNDQTKKYEIIWGNREVKSKNTIFSLNWIPLGGFVNIKGENGGAKKEKDSFVSKSAWIRIKVLAAGVTMNLILAWFLLAIVFAQGAPEAISDNQKVKDAKVQISQVVENTPAKEMGLAIGDQVLKICTKGQACQSISKVEELKKYIDNNKGKEIVLTVKRGGETLELKGIPRIEFPSDQGALGVGLARTALIDYPWYEAIGKGLEAVFTITILIVTTLGSLLGQFLSGSKPAMDVAGPIGIAIMTKQVSALGFTYVLQFAAMLSINLAIINILPFPALDGGRIFFILIEKLKGSPVNQKFENMANSIGMLLLLLLMVVVTFHDFIQFEIIDKIRGLF
ncbi:MAG: Membrane-associated zinc metalloprotease [Candidatus Moranbacteria bacterium GW2011_GWF2_34_56]|nr:MAG: Membrane-associated zinc metalloprotease [Candidatus Moranbacteria bacterium GW2011_GWF1_34_10]KKP65322.1 MAG: Membrane-associated zinc metalloprotease [Candidatus Moranbacteria bacterium GW2011_GWF2_34_56]